MFPKFEHCWYCMTIEYQEDLVRGLCRDCYVRHSEKACEARPGACDVCRMIEGE